MKKWEDLPQNMQNEQVRKYYDILQKKKFSLFLKRAFDIVVSGGALLVLSPLFLALAIAIKLDSKGPVFYRQVRVSRYGGKFRIFKFRTMVQNADSGSSLTVGNDMRITKVGVFLRRHKLDELSQLLDVLRGRMSFVGTRPEVPEYVATYTDEMFATLLMPAGITSRASIYYRDESRLLAESDDPEYTYITKVLPDKMKHNLKAIETFSFLDDIKIIFMTVFAVSKNDETEKQMVVK